jgi:hypothetical protein
MMASSIAALHQTTSSAPSTPAPSTPALEPAELQTSTISAPAEDDEPPVDPTIIELERRIRSIGGTGIVYCRTKAACNTVYVGVALSLVAVLFGWRSASAAIIHTIAFLAPLFAFTDDITGTKRCLIMGSTPSFTTQTCPLTNVVER